MGSGYYRRGSRGGEILGPYVGKDGPVAPCRDVGVVRYVVFRGRRTVLCVSRTGVVLRSIENNWRAHAYCPGDNWPRKVIP